jgi:arginase
MSNAQGNKQGFYCAPYYFGKYSAKFEEYARRHFAAAIIRAERENLGSVATAIYHHVPRLVIGGDCFTALPCVLAHRAEIQCIYWFDAHGDFNDEVTTASGFLGGMPLAALRGLACDRLLALFGKVVFPSGKCIHVGGRAFDLLEKHRMRAAGIGLRRSLPTRLVANSHVHLDVDVLRLADAPNVTHPTRGGIRARDLERFLLANADRIVSLSVSAWRVETEPPPAVVRMLNRFLEYFTR